MKKIVNLLVVVVLMLSVCGFNGNVDMCDHQHDEECGYIAETDSGCTHVHNIEYPIKPCVENPGPVA